MRKGMFDYDGDGKLDANERAAENQFIDEVILGENKNKHDHLTMDPTGSRKRGEPVGISFCGKPLYDAKKDSNGVTILKSLAVIGLCIGGFAVPIALDLGDLGMIICIGLGIGLSMKILKNI